MTSDSQSFLHQDFFTTQGDAPDIDVAHVRTRHNTDNIQCAAPSDLEAESWRAVTRADARAAGAMPYCMDIAARRSVYVSGLSAERAQSAPFYYLTARREAQEIFSVPWKSGAVYPAKAQPVFVFSPGRCGSTLLSRLLFEAGIPTISEPDFYSQFTAGALYDKQNARFYSTEVKDALGTLTHDLASACGAEKYFVIKLRSEVCFITRFLVNIFPEPHKTIFMLRDFPGWAKSTIRHFAYPPEAIVSKYISGLKSLVTLSEISECHIVSYEKLLADPHAVTAALATFLEAEVAEGAVERALGTDAQKDTPLARNTGAEPEHFEERLQQTLAFWHRPELKPWRELTERLVL